MLFAWATFGCAPPTHPARQFTSLEGHAASQEAEGESAVGCECTVADAIWKSAADESTVRARRVAMKNFIVML